MSSRVIVSRFATHLTLVGVFLTGNVLCAFAPNYGVLMVMMLPRNSHIVKIGFLPQFCNSLRMRKTIRGLRCWRVGQ